MDIKILALSQVGESLEINLVNRFLYFFEERGMLTDLSCPETTPGQGT